MAFNGESLQTNDGEILCFVVGDAEVEEDGLIDLVGSVDGDSLGILGISDGAADSGLVGTILGPYDLDPLGDIVGVAVGTGDGATDGDLDKAKLGLSDEGSIGDLDGIDDSYSLGNIVGLAVGNGDADSDGGLTGE